MKRNVLACFFWIACAGLLPAQTLLTLEDAIKTALEKNYAVQIYKNQEEIAKLQNNLGNAGMSPSVMVNGAYNASMLNSHQVFNTGVVQDRNGAVSRNLTASVSAVWTVFDGLRMFAVKKRLGLSEEAADLSLKQQMENTVYDIIVAYYGIVRIKELIKASQQNLMIYQERKKIAQLRLEIGSDSRVELLLSQSDENRARSEIMQLELQLLSAKANLNTLLNARPDVDFTTSDTIVLNYNPSLEELKKEVLSKNPSILLSKKNESILEQTVKEARSANLPWVNVNGAYIFNRSQSEAGIIFLNRQSGPTAGVSVNWLLFNGNRNRNLIKERSIAALNQKLLTEQTVQQVDAAVYIYYQSFLMNRKIADLEALTVKDAKELQEISLERYRIGKSNLLVTIEAQKAFEDAKVRYINALYSMKVGETELLRTNGVLVK